MSPSPEAGDAAPAAPVTREQFRDAFLAERCSIQQACCGGAASTPEKAKEALDECIAFFKLTEYIEPPNATFHPEHAATCMRYLASSKTNGCNFTDSFDQKDYESCDRVFTDATCDLQSQCFSYVRIDFPGDCIAGKCVLFDFNKGAGEACINGVECGGGTYCDDTQKKCQPLPVAPNACSPASARALGAPGCANGNYCDADNKCQPVLGDGDLCTAREQCKATSYCAATSFCAPAAAVGSDCTNTPCVTGADCGTTTKKCYSYLPKKLGDACDFDPGSPGKALDVCPSQDFAELICSSTTKTCGHHPLQRIQCPQQ